jgi:hypothetical protein
MLFLTRDTNRQDHRLQDRSAVQKLHSTKLTKTTTWWLYYSIGQPLQENVLYRWGKGLSIKQWWVQLAVVGGGLTGVRRGGVPVRWCTGWCDHRDDLWWPLYPQMILHLSLNANEHYKGVDVARKAHSPQTCTLPGRIYSALFSCQHWGEPLCASTWHR